MSLEQLMALARRLDKQPAAPRRVPASGSSRPRSYQLSAQEWAELFPNAPARLASPAQRPSTTA